MTKLAVCMDPFLKKLSKDSFIQQCRATEKSIDDYESGNEWKVEDGVRAATLSTILKNIIFHIIVLILQINVLTNL